MFRNFKGAQFDHAGVTINYKKGGSGPPLLLLHGYPQTHVIWHKMADQLAEHYTVVVSDLRGYGDSSKPKTDAAHSTYSKRASATDQVALMKDLGFDEFLLVGHDRGGRVGHRLALDHPDVVQKLAVLDIAPTYTMYTTTDMEFAKAYYHWFFLIQPHDIPERMIGSDPLYFLEKKFGQWGREDSAFTKEAFAEYLRCLTPETIHASCEDYRASASIDIEHDQVDLDAGHKMKCPLLCLWGEKGFVGNKYNMIQEWSNWATDVKAYGVPCGHYLPEEAPDETLEFLLKFLKE